MEKELQIFNFENNNFTVISINNESYWIGKEVCDYLEIKNHSDAMGKLKEGSQKLKLSYDACKQIGLTELENLQIGTKGVVLLTEAGLYKLSFKSEKPNAEEFTDWISEEVLPKIRKTGKFDAIENQIEQIEDEKERQLKLTIKQLEELIKINPNNILAVINYNQTKSELNTYLSNKKLEEVNTKLDDLQEDFDKQSEQLKKTTVLREGDMSAEAVAKKFNVFSINDKPHNRFADYLAKDLGFYIHPEGAAGYRDLYISVNLENKFGQTRSVVKYSKKAVEEMEKYIEENGLKFEEPPQYYKRGAKKGKFNYTYLLFENGERIKVNELTYKLYSSEYNEE